MEENQIYRSNYFITFFHSFLVFVILILIDDGLEINWEAFIFATALMLLINLFLILYYKITINSNSLKGYDVWGIYHTIEWNTIVEVKPIRIAWLKFVKVVNTTNRPLWLPLFLNDMNLFIDKVETIVPKENPLRIFLETFRTNKDT